MRYPPVLIFHIFSGTLGLLSGLVAVFLRKGSRWHRLTGNVFVLSMLGLGASGAYLGFMKSQVTNVLAGIFTIYLVTTAWLTARRRDMQRSAFDWIALLAITTYGGTQMTFGLRAVQSATDALYGYRPGLYFTFGTLALISAAGDVRMILRGLSGTQRLVRHLWRMCFALFIASGSIFIARPHLFPMVLRKTYVILFLGILPLSLMIFWVIRVRVTSATKKKLSARVRGVYSLQT
jgi:uncharacterized membrane protein